MDEKLNLETDCLEIMTHAKTGMAHSKFEIVSTDYSLDGIKLILTTADPSKTYKLSICPIDEKGNQYPMWA